jgi:Tol biopolymer transport system component/DNA-binding winged helix-turn-helix (wHTH) protein
MNEHVAIGPKLSLARELPFNLAGTNVRPASLEVETGGKTIALEPRVMKVLVALHRARGQPVSRDEMIDLCWEGRIVTEGALNRCIAQLRKAFAANERIRLDTIPTVGYRLQASAEVRRIGAAEPPPNPVPQAARTSRRAVWVGLAVGVAVVAASVVALMPRPVAWTAKSYRPITSDRGLETHPALSPDGSQLVYAQRPDQTVARDLYLRGVDQGTPVRLTTDLADDHSAVWAPGGDRIAFVRTSTQGPCQLVVVPIPVGPERVVGRCQSASYSRISWLDDTHLVLGDRPSRNEPWRIRAVDIASGYARDLTSPSRETLGDSDPAVSPNGRYVTFRRTLLHGADDLFLKDLKTGRERALTTDGWKAAGYVWSKDSRHIFYSSNRGGSFGLWTVDIRRNAPPERISLGLGQLSFSRMSIDGDHRLAVEASRTRANLAEIDRSGRLTPVTNASGWDSYPVASADGAIAYTSSRSGGSELWVTRPDGQAVQVTSLGGSYVHSASWSPDSQTLAFVGVKGRKANLYTVGRDGARLQTVLADGLDKMDTAWTPDGRAIRYLQRTADGYRLMQVAATGGQPREIPEGRGWEGFRLGPDGELYGADGRGEVRRLGQADVLYTAASNDNWVIARDGIYVLTPRREQPAALWFKPWNGSLAQIASVPTSGGHMTLSPDGRLFIVQLLDDEVDVGLFELNKGR